MCWSSAISTSITGVSIAVMCAVSWPLPSAVSAYARQGGEWAPERVGGGVGVEVLDDRAVGADEAGFGVGDVVLDAVLSSEGLCFV